MNYSESKELGKGKRMYINRAGTNVLRNMMEINGM